MLFRKKIEPRCAYCEKGSRVGEREVACIRHGVVPPEFYCRAFKYDPLKRVPPRPVRLKTDNLSPDNFKL
ncbi:MAG: hypothetical protein VB112_01565 [Oscillospiraceae bacterium]|nr:hypothetical protein [Oscillospiraceae bacterium]